PRVREDLEALLAPLLVHALEVLPVDDDLAAQRELAVVPDARRHSADGPDVGGDVLARDAVAARRRLREAALVMDDLDARAVELRLDRVHGALPRWEPLFDPPVELRHVLRGVGVV